MSDTDVGLGCEKPDAGSLGERLQQLVAEAGGRRQEFADRVGMPLRTLNHQIERNSLGMEAAVSIATAMDVSLDWLLVGRGPMRFEQLMGRGMRLSKPEIIPPEAPVPAGLPDGYAVIPRYEARAGAGAGVINPSDRIVEQMVVSEEYIRRRLRRRPEDMALLEALGDSMSPTIQDGDVMMIDVSVTELRASSIYVLLMDEELIVKRLHKMTDGRILIIPDNERYPREEVTPSERAPLRIVGQVVWYGRPMPG